MATVRGQLPWPLGAHTGPFSGGKMLPRHVIEAVGCVASVLVCGGEGAGPVCAGGCATARIHGCVCGG